MKANYIYQEKTKGGYIETYRQDDEIAVYSELAAELIAKKINSCSWIRSIQRKPLYNGFDEITVYYDHGKGRRVYTVESH